MRCEGWTVLSFEGAALRVRNLFRDLVLAGWHRFLFLEERGSHVSSGPTLERKLILTKRGVSDFIARTVPLSSGPESSRHYDSVSHNLLLLLVIINASLAATVAMEPRLRRVMVVMLSRRACTWHSAVLELVEGD
jgi:hypothetical protein